MKQIAQIDIQYQNLPKEIFNDFITREGEGDIFIVNLLYDEDPLDNFTGPLPDVVIYIQENWDFLVAASVKGAISGTFAFLIKSLWTKVAKYYEKNNQDSGNKTISLNLKISPDKMIEYSLEGDINPALVSEVTDKMVAGLLNKEAISQSFNNPELIDSTDSITKVKYFYDEEKKLWLPFNQAENKKYWEDLRNDAMNNFSS